MTAVRRASRGFGAAILRRSLPVFCALALPLAAADDGAADTSADSTLRPDQTADEWEQGRFTAERAEARVRLFGTWYENYFRVPDDDEAATVRSLSVEGRVTLTLNRARRVKMYLQAIREDFQDADILTSPTYSIGLRVDGERHALDAAFRYLEDREQLDIDDLAEPSDIYIYFGSYNLRFAEDWEWQLEGELRDQRFPAPRQIQDSELYSGSTSIRYRGWGRRFSPELGYESRRREAVDPHDDYDEKMPWLKLRFSPFDALTASLRFRDRRREYSTVDPDDSNFGRVDERDEWTLRADWVVARRVALNLEAERLSARSTREDRDFTANMLVAGTTVKVGPMRETRSRRSRPPLVPPSPPAAAPAAASAPAPDPGPELAPSTPPPSAPEPPPPAPPAPATRESAAASSSAPPPATLTRARLLGIETAADDAAGPSFALRVDGAYEVRSFALRGPHRFVVDLLGVLCEGACGALELGGGPVVRVRSAQFERAPIPIVRVVFDLRDPGARVEVGRAADRVAVRVVSPER